MSEVAIRVENLGKRYVLRHQQGIRRYKTLRDLLTERWKRLFAERAPDSRLTVKSTTEEFWALKDVSFEIAQGEAVGIIGRNGAGKSTLLKLLSRITEPTTGRVELQGRVASLLEVGTGFHPELTGRENIFLNGSILGMNRGEIRRRFDEIVSFAEVEKFLDTPVKRYSSGMYMRLAFAVAAHLEPEILIVDEVLAVGDAAFQAKCLGKMQDVTQRGERTVLFVSHNMGAINTFCSRGIYLASGKIEKEGPVGSVISYYHAQLTSIQHSDLSSLRVRGTGETVFFTKCRLVNGENGILSFNQPLVYELEIVTKTSLKSLSIGFSIYNQTGGCVGSALSVEEFDVDSDKSVCLTLSISSSNLSPGNYYSGFSIGRGGRFGIRADYDIVVGTPQFEISNISSDDAFLANWDSSWGNIVFSDCHIRSNLPL